MPLADSSRAIGAVTGLLSDRLEQLAGHNITIGRPEVPGTNGTNPRLNLFLYEAQLDPHLRNTPLDEGQSPPLWLALRYLLTAFDTAGESDTVDALGVLGDGLRALQGTPSLALTGLSTDDLSALSGNPQDLRVTLTDAPANLLSSLMQGPDEHYRFSMAFEVRPVMIASPSAVDASLLVGIDNTDGSVRADGGLDVQVDATLGPRLDRAEPASFAAGDPPVRLVGRDIDERHEARLGPLTLPLARDAAGDLVFDPSAAALPGESISAGGHPLSVELTLPSGRRRASDLVVVSLLPAVTAVSHHPAADPADPDELELQGTHLGKDSDDVVVALYRDGTTVASYDDVVDVEDEPAQTRRRVRLTGTAPAAGDHRVIVRVNGSQARQAPTVSIP
jgi:hypothetical protein